MPLLHEIQQSIVSEGSDLGSVLLKLRLLASKLGSDLLEEWVKHESEGYPKDIEVPPYRIVGASYHGTFLGPLGSGIKNAPIPQYLVEKFGGKQWVNIEIRESITGVEDLVKSSSDGDGTLQIDASNLILLLQGKIYEGYSCNDIRASISRTGLSEIQQSVRSRILELALELEKKIPAASQISIGASSDSKADREKVRQISQQIIYGDVGTAISDAQGSNVTVNVKKNDTNSLANHLIESGFPQEDAKAIAEIMETETPESVEEPFGEKAKTWIATNMINAVKGTWKIGISLATKILHEAALKYYDLK